MALSTANQDAIELRREQVAHLRLQGLSAREIADRLSKGPKKLVNPDTNEPYTHTTILSDLKALKKTWMKSANTATGEHVARQLAEIQEIKRLAWRQRDGDLALKAVEKEMKLLGTMKQPDGIQININIELVTQLVQAIEARGDSASEVFEELLQEFQRADVAANQS